MTGNLRNIPKLIDDDEFEIDVPDEHKNALNLTLMPELVEIIGYTGKILEMDVENKLVDAKGVKQGNVWRKQ
jgi:hypothetical protein